MKNPDTAFAPCTRGVILGVEYDSVAWTWKIPDEKLARLLEQIELVCVEKRVRQEDLASLVGKILHYGPLVPGGRFNLDHMLKARAAAAPSWCRTPSRWWRTACSRTTLRMRTTATPLPWWRR